MELIRAFSKKNLNISSSYYRKKQELQRSPLKVRRKSRDFAAISQETDALCGLLTPSPAKCKKKQSFRDKMDAFHNKFVENVNNTLLLSNSYRKNSREKATLAENSAKILKNRSELNLRSKTRDIFADFEFEDYRSNANLYGFSRFLGNLLRFVKKVTKTRTLNPMNPRSDAEISRITENFRRKTATILRLSRKLKRNSRKVTA